MQDTIILILLVLGVVYGNYQHILNAYFKNPWIYAGVVGLGLVGYALYYLAGHYMEKFSNKISMMRKGIKDDQKDVRASYPFRQFDLAEHMNEFLAIDRTEDETFLGLNAETDNKEAVAVSDHQRGQHMQVLGMTGTGKTAGVFLPLIYQDALKNRPVIILDAKGELSAINQLNALLHSIGREEDFLLFSLVHRDISCTYNPLYTGECDPQIIIDSFFSHFNDDNSFYRETSKTIFTNVFHILHSLGKPFTPMDVYTYLTDGNCRSEVNKRIIKDNQKGTLYLKLLNTMLIRLVAQYKGWEHVVTGFNNYLLAHSDALLNEADSDIVLTDCIRQRKIVYFQLPTNAYPIQSVSIARMIQANLRYISSLIQVGKLPNDILVSVIIDEYASFAEESFVEVLNKARSSGMMVTIAHQSLSDLSGISESFMKRIDENTLNKIYLKQTDPELCELIARSMGTFTKEEKTYRMTGGRFGNQIHVGESSNRIVNEFHFSPDKVKDLHKFGQGYFVYRGDKTQVCVNFGCFQDEQRPYQRKAKSEKSQGLELFDKYFVSPSKPARKRAIKKKEEEELIFED